MKKKFSAIDWALVLIFMSVAGYVYVGFWFPDRYGHGWSYVFLLHFIRLFFPVCAGLAVWLYWRVRTGRTPLANIAMLFVSLLLGGLLLYPLASEYFYRGRFLHRAKRLYHPYLQITPPEFTYRERTDGNTVRPYRIFCLGGSTTEYPDSTGLDWPTRVERNVQELMGDRPIEIYNCGREWYTSLHQLINFQFNLRQYKPDMLIIMHGINDLWINCDFNPLCTGEFRPDYGHYDGPVGRLVNRRSLWSTLTHTLGSFWYFEDRRSIETDSFPGIESFDNFQRTCIELAQKDSIQVVLMTQPHVFTPNMVKEKHPYLFMYEFNGHGDSVEWTLNTAHNGIIQYNQKTRELANEMRCFLIDLEHLIPEERENYRDDVHYTTAGFELMGKNVSAGMNSILTSEQFLQAPKRH